MAQQQSAVGQAAGVISKAAGELWRWIEKPWRFLLRLAALLLVTAATVAMLQAWAGNWSAPPVDRLAYLIVALAAARYV